MRKILLSVSVLLLVLLVSACGKKKDSQPVIGNPPPRPTPVTVLQDTTTSGSQPVVPARVSLDKAVLGELSSVCHSGNRVMQFPHPVPPNNIASFNVRSYKDVMVVEPNSLKIHERYYLDDNCIEWIQDGKDIQRWYYTVNSLGAVNGDEWNIAYTAHSYTRAGQREIRDPFIRNDGIKLTQVQSTSVHGGTIQRLRFSTTGETYSNLLQ